MGIDPRGPRFSAAITTVILAVVLVTASAWLLAVQAVVFAVGSVLGLRYSPYGLLYRRLVRPGWARLPSWSRRHRRGSPRRSAWSSRSSAWPATRRA
jgi:Domain of unknown function (DUF4395)